jgi:putative transposase
MANTYTQIYIQIVFVVKRRQNLILEVHREELQKYISGIIENRGFKLMAIYCMPDHTHVLISMKPNLSISDLVRDIKTGSAKFIEDKKWIKGEFNWQTGFGAFSYSHSHIDKVVKYILNQGNNHHKKTFKEEYVDFLQKYNVDFKDEYLFEQIL